METMQGPFGQQVVQNNTRTPWLVHWIAVKRNGKNSNIKKASKQPKDTNRKNFQKIDLVLTVKKIHAKVNKRLATESQTTRCKSKPWYAKTMKILSMVAISTNAEDTNKTP